MTTNIDADHPWCRTIAVDAARARRESPVTPGMGSGVKFPARVWEPTSIRDGALLWSSREPKAADEDRCAELLATFQCCAEPGAP